MVQTTNLIATLVWLRRLGADEQNPLDAYRAGFVTAPGLVVRCGSLAYLTPDGWELAERMIAAADDQLTLWQREQAGTLTPEDTEKRRVP